MGCDETGDEGRENGSIGEGHGHDGLKVEVGEDKEEDDEQQVEIEDGQER